MCEIDILDTAGQEEYAAIRDNYYRSGEGFILVYSINDRESFNSMNDFRSQIIRSLNDLNPPLLLVGNKSDLQRKVAEDEALNLADKWKASSRSGNRESLTKWREVSAKRDDGINEVFSEIVKLIQRKREIEEEKETNETRKKKKRRSSRCLIQ